MLLSKTNKDDQDKAKTNNNEPETEKASLLGPKDGTLFWLGAHLWADSQTRKEGESLRHSP